LTSARKKGDRKLGTGHGILHLALIAALVKDGELLGSQMMRITREKFYYDSLFSSHNPNHGIFCSDTCHAVPAILMEMLVSSEPGRLEVPVA